MNINLKELILLREMPKTGVTLDPKYKIDMENNLKFKMSTIDVFDRIMNRDIKYRVWDVEDKLWVENPWKFHLECDGSFLTYQQNLYEKNWEYEQVRYEFYVVQMFTGMTDKNGKDIYEGDIIRTRYKMDEHGDFEEEIGPVYFEHGAFGTKNDWFCNWLFAPSVSFEVIGNIFENKELLK